MFVDDYEPNYPNSRPDYYDTMQVCLNGHHITSDYDSSPEVRKDYCDLCGAKTIFQCQECKEKIRGYYNCGIIDTSPVKIPSHCHKCGKPYPWKSKLTTTNSKTNVNRDGVIDMIFKKFNDVVVQLRERHDNRNTLDVRDEYDVQDLLHSLLRLYFDDIRPEEWNPSYAGSSTRSDFLLKKEKTIIEVKYPRKGLTNKKLKEELIVDKEQYKRNEDCETLYCFIYDPDNKIINPRGLENDISENSSGFVCKVIIV